MTHIDSANQQTTLAIEKLEDLTEQNRQLASQNQKNIVQIMGMLQQMQTLQQESYDMTTELHSGIINTSISKEEK